MAPPLPEEVRRHCADVARRARWVRIDPHATTRAEGVAGLDAAQHFLEGEPEAVAPYVLILDTINVGSGWFPTLRDGTTVSLTERLTAHVRAHDGPWTAAQLRDLDAAAVAAVLRQDATHPLMALYAEGLRQLGRLLGAGGALEL